MTHVFSCGSNWLLAPSGDASRHVDAPHTLVGSNGLPLPRSGTRTKARLVAELGFAFRTSILPNGDGPHPMMLNKALLAGANVDAGASVRVVGTAPARIE